MRTDKTLSNGTIGKVYKKKISVKSDEPEKERKGLWDEGSGTEQIGGC